MIMNNVIGPSCGYGANGTGITITATNTFGSFNAQGNVLCNNTTAPWAQSANIVVASGSTFYVKDNLGFLPPTILTSSFSMSATATGTAVTGMTNFLPVGEYVISGTFVGTQSSTASAHSFQWVASGGLVASGTAAILSQCGITLAGATAVPVFSGASETTYSTAVATGSFTASDLAVMQFYTTLTVTTAGTITLDGFGPDAITLNLGSQLNYQKVA
jgi:hypothetical protein